MNEKYEAIEETRQMIDHIRYVEGREQYNNACDAFARGRSFFADGKEQFAYKELELAQKLFRDSINTYSTIENTDLKKNYLAKAYFNLIGSLAENKKSDPNDSIKAINETKDLGLISADWNLHISKAYYNSGIRQADPISQIESFSQSKIYDPTNVKAMYYLGVACMAAKEYNEAKKEFETILCQEWSEEKLSSDMQLNSWCQLKECQSELHEDISNTLKLAWQFIKDLPQTFFTNTDLEIQKFRHKMVNDIYVDHITKNLSEVDVGEFAKFLCKFNSEVFEEALEALNNELSSFIQRDCTEDAKHLGEFIISVSKTLSGEDMGYDD